RRASGERRRWYGKAKVERSPPPSRGEIGYPKRGRSGQTAHRLLFDDCGDCRAAEAARSGPRRAQTHLGAPQGNEQRPRACFARLVRARGPALRRSVRDHAVDANRTRQVFETPREDRRRRVALITPSHALLAGPRPALADASAAA